MHCYKWQGVHNSEDTYLCWKEKQVSTVYTYARFQEHGLSWLYGGNQFCCWRYDTRVMGTCCSMLRTEVQIPTDLRSQGSHKHL